VAYVSGNDLIVKMEDGQMRHFPNIPESARVTFDGKELGVRELKPGMKLERTITVTTIPRTITTVETVTGKVWHVNPPTSVVLTLANGESQQFTIPKDQKFNVDGQETDAWGLRKGMTITATRIREVPETVVQHERQVSGQMPPPPPPLPANTPILIARAEPAPPPTASARSSLPETGSFAPLIGLLGLLLTGSAVLMRVVRR
jgi:LPXTG-motif cell wall-anchored protein